jgi:hypothetical protein
MSGGWKTGGQRRPVGHMNDDHGHNVAFDVDRSVVVIRRGGQDIRLSAGSRDPFMRLFMEAEREAGTWTAEHTETTADPCTYEVIHGDRASVPCVFPHGHTGLHSFMPAT